MPTSSLWPSARREKTREATIGGRQGTQSRNYNVEDAVASRAVASHAVASHAVELDACANDSVFTHFTFCGDTWKTIADVLTDVLTDRRYRHNYIQTHIVNYVIAYRRLDRHTDTNNKC